MEPLQVTGRVGSGRSEVSDSQGFDAGWRITDGDGAHDCSDGHWRKLLGKKEAQFNFNYLVVH